MNRQAFKVSFQDSVAEEMFDGLGVRRVGLTEEHQTSDNLSVLNHGILKPGLKLPWFYHEDKDEVIIVNKGSGIMHFEEAEPISIAEGDVLYVPAKTKHSLENNGSSNLEAVFLKVYA